MPLLWFIGLGQDPLTRNFVLGYNGFELNFISILYAVQGAQISSLPQNELRGR